MKTTKVIVMLGTSFETKGGVSAVVNLLRSTGLFTRFSIIYLPTHCDGTKLTKVFVCLHSWFRYVRLLLQKRVALVHIHVSSNASFWRKTLFFLTTFLFNVPSILHLHGGGFAEFYESRCNGAMKWIVRYVFDQAALIVVLAENWACWVAGITRHSRIRIISNPVLLPPLPESGHRDSATILFLGQLSRAKGTYDLLLAVAELVIDHPNLKLLLAGAGDTLLVKSEAARLGIEENVHLLGWISGQCKSEILQQASIFVLPSYAEGMPMSILEAMAAGLPVISTSVGGVSEAISDGVEGYLFCPGDVQSLTSALNRLLRDNGLRLRMGNAAREKIERSFSVQRILPQIEKLYTDSDIS